MLRFDIITIFPEFFRTVFDFGIVRRARAAGLVEIAAHDLRAWTTDKHKVVDDRPFGGGDGMVLKPEPLCAAVEALTGAHEARELAGTKTRVVLLSPQGRVFGQKVAAELAEAERIVLICGRYEGVDERVAEFLADREVSIGNFVLSGGELPAALIVDAVTRLLPGALGNEASARQETGTSRRATQPRVRWRLACVRQQVCPSGQRGRRRRWPARLPRLPWMPTRTRGRPP